MSILGSNVQFCNKKCCKLLLSSYSSNKVHKRSASNRKAGICIHDTKQNKILMVQSRGNFWGFPKGTVKQNETDKQCAIREVYEETGLCIEEELLQEYVEIKEKAVYYYISQEECSISIQNHIVDNDVNSLGWIKIDCLEELVIEERMLLNQHCKIVLKKLFDKSFIPSIHNY